MKIISHGPKWARIRAKKSEVELARWFRWSEGKSRPEPVIMDGTENYLTSGAKAYYKGGGVWLISGYHPQSYDVLRSLMKMRGEEFDNSKEDEKFWSRV